MRSLQIDTFIPSMCVKGYTNALHANISIDSTQTLLIYYRHTKVLHMQSLYVREQLTVAGKPRKLSNVYFFAKEKAIVMRTAG